MHERTRLAKHKLTPEDFRDISKTQSLELGGKTCFFTNSGIVGIATAAVEPGDILAQIRDSPVYLILREVEAKDTKGKPTALQHRIVARSVIHSDPDKTKELVDSAPDQAFHVV